MICTSCYYQGKGKANTRGSFVIELILWLFFIIPGLIYTVWRLTTKAKVCPKCGQNTLIPEDSPRGVELAQKYPVIKDKQVESNPHAEEFKLKPFLKKWWLLLVLIAIAVIFINSISKSHTQSSNSTSVNTASPQPITEEYKDSLAKMFCDNRSDGKGYLGLQHFVDEKSAFETTTKKPTTESCKAIADYCLKVWNKEDCENIANEKIWIGMTDLQLYYSWGIPKDQNNTVVASGVHTQWVYGDFGSYVYLEGKTDKDLKVTSWQD